MSGPGLLVGVAVGTYADKGWPPLETLADVEGWRSALVADYLQDPEPLVDPDEGQIGVWLRQLRDRLPDGGPLVAVWSGHGQLDEAASGGLRLIARDTPCELSEGLRVEDFVAAVAKSGANQILVVLDTCSSGAGLIPAAQAAQAAFQAFPPAGGQLWFGVVAASAAGADAYDGLLGRQLRRLLLKGPDRPELQTRWSRQNRLLRGDDLCDALQKEWNNPAQQPDVLTRGSAWWMFRNPLFDEGAPPEVVEHLLVAARGTASLVEQSAFTGRVEEVNTVIGWVRDRQPGIRVVTGSPGTGKSAVVGRVVSLSVGSERQRLQEQGGWEHHDPGEGSVAAHVHARGLTADRMAQLLDGWLHSQESAVLVPREEGPRNAAQLVGDVQHAVEQGKPTPVVVIDGLDEARGQAFDIVDELLVRLAQFTTVIVATRNLPAPDQGRPGLVRALAPQGADLDLDDPGVAARGLNDVSNYVVRRLEGRDDRMDPAAIARQLTAKQQPATSLSQPFLLARLVTDQLRQHPVDTGVAGWEQLVATSVAEAFDVDLARVDRPSHVIGEVQGAERARLLLEGLGWGFGRGLPEDEWLTVANAIANESFVRDDVWWLLEQLGRYIIQDGEDGQAAYRIAHASLADHIRPPFPVSAEALFDPKALPVAHALAGRLQMLADAGIAADSAGYLWRYLWRHAAAAGPTGLAVLRQSTERHPVLLFDLALADLEVAERLRFYGRRAEAVGPTEEAVRLYRALAADNPAFVPNLAMSLNNLGVRYSQVGRRAEAVGPTEEAVRLRRALAADNPAFVPDLASALNNLGIRYSEVERDDPDRIDTVWRQVLDELPQARSLLLAMRCSATEPGAPGAVGWLVEGLQSAADADTGPVWALHEQGRRHRSADPDGFDTAWQEATGQAPPGWLTLETELLEAAAGWIDTPTYEAERDHLAAHPELLQDAAEDAVADVLLQVSPDKRDRYVALRRAACEQGVEAAYRPLLLGLLAHRFVAADWHDKRQLLTDRRDELLTAEAAAALAGDEDDAQLQVAAALLVLASLDADMPVFDAVESPAGFAGLLHRYALAGDTQRLGPTAHIALRTASDEADFGLALLYVAVAMLLADPSQLDTAAELVVQARQLAPDRQAEWLALLGEIAVAQPQVAGLFGPLTGPLPDDDQEAGSGVDA